jgi:hypothetical protein
MQTLQNGIEVPTNGDDYNLTVHLAEAFKDANVVIPVPSQIAEDALVKFDGMTIVRTDQVGRPHYTWDGDEFLRKDPKTWRFERTVATDSNAGDITGTTSLKSGTITAAPAGLYRIDGRTCLYATTGVVRGFVYVKAGGTTEEARNDFNGDSNPRSLPATFDYAHAGGNLTVEIGYRQTSGSPLVTGQASGLTRVIATFLGN